ncbi:exodeoxyribonuclease VII large subunit [Salinispira pacifica]|nr:exodeoxyribonuclease VII large subunit [Salinispira pacifica]
MNETVQRPYTVSQLTREIKLMLEGSYPQVLLEGEISNFRPASSGHWYFSIKDEDAMIQAVMFRGAQRSVSMMPSDGQMVKVRGNISVYAKRGNYQIICTSLEASGEGRILQMLEERKRRLAAEGLFSQEEKKPLPGFPRRVAVLSSESGAAVRDIIRVIRRRAPWMDVVVINIPVQGEKAAETICRQLAMADEHTLGDVIIIGRGGGSLEDLLPFSDEAVVRSIRACSTPVISAVGHEIDWALSDFAADVRAPTPSAAAEMLCVNAEELRSRVLTAGRVIIQSFGELRRRMIIALKPFRPELLEDSFRRLTQPHQLALDDNRERLLEGMQRYLERRKTRLEGAFRELKACDPYDVLNRGYAIVRDHENRVVSRAGALKTGSDIRVQFRDGMAEGNIRNINTNAGINTETTATKNARKTDRKTDRKTAKKTDRNKTEDNE